MKFVVVDPGTATGVLFGDLSASRYGRMGSPMERLREGLASGDVQVEEWDTARWWEPGLVDRVEKFMRQRSRAKGGWTSVPLVVEDFILRTQDKRKTTLDPIRVTAALVAVLRDRGWRGKLVMQQPSQMSIATDERLRAWKLWVKGSAHKRDAMRHAVAYLNSRSVR